MAIAVLSCSQEGKMQTLKNGLRYVHHVKNTGDTAKVGDLMRIHFQQWAVNKGKDTLLTSTYTMGEPMTVQMGDPSLGKIGEALRMVHSGDSISLYISIDSLLGGAPRPPFIDSATDVRFEMKIIKILTMQEYEKEQKEMAEKQKATDAELIKQYIADNKLANVQTTESGLHYIITAPGNGPAPKGGDQVELHYTGTFLDGNKFDSSLDRGQPFNFPAGVGQVVPGFDEGVLLLKQGGKATLIIPSGLAYGPQGNPPTIKPNSIIKFDIELLKVTSGGGAGMPGMAVPQPNK